MIFGRMWSTKQLMVPIDFHSRNKLWKLMDTINCSVTHILQNVFCVVLRFDFLWSMRHTQTCAQCLLILPQASIFEGSQKLFEASGHTYTHTFEGRAPLQPWLYNRLGQSEPTGMQMKLLNFQATHQPLTKVRLERLTCTWCPPS